MAAKLRVDQSPVSICMAAAKGVQLVIDDTIAIAIVVGHGPMLCVGRIMRSAAGEKPGYPKRYEKTHMIYRDSDKARQGVVANALNVSRNGAVGFIVWLDASYKLIS